MVTYRTIILSLIISFNASALSFSIEKETQDGTLQKAITIDSNAAYLVKNSKYLGGCFATKSINTMLCKLKNYNNISRGKLPIISCS